MTADGRWSWVVSAACFVNGFCIFGPFRSSGVIFASLINVFDVTREQASWPFLLASTVGSLIAAINGVLCHYFSIRTIALSVSLLSFIGIALCFVSRSITDITIYFGVIYGSGIGIVHLCNLITICQYFDKYKTIGTGIYSAGPAAASFVLPPLIKYLVEIYGLRGAFLIASGITLHGFLAAALFRPKRVSPKESTFTEKNNSQRNQSGVLKVLRCWAKIFKCRAFHMIWVSYVVFQFNYLVFPTVIVDYASDLKIDMNASVYLLSAYSFADLCGRLSCGWITDVTSMKRTYVVAIAFTIQGLLLFMIALSEAYVFLMVMAIGVGFITGSLMVNWSPLFAEYLGLTNLPSAIGIMYTFSGILTLSYPSIIGYYRDVKGNYIQLFFSCAAFQLLIAVLWFLEPCIIKVKPLTKEEILPQ